MAETKMTPQEVATFWFKKCSELEAKLKDTEEYWSKHSADLQDKLNESEVARRNLANDLGELKNQIEGYKMSLKGDNKDLQRRLDAAINRADCADNEKNYYERRYYTLLAKNEELTRELTICKTKADEQVTIAQENVNSWKANYDNLVNNSFGMTYEQIIDLKCENARLREENTKFEKWQRLLDKIKIF